MQRLSTDQTQHLATLYLKLPYSARGNICTEHRTLFLFRQEPANTSCHI